MPGKQTRLLATFGLIAYKIAYCLSLVSFGSLLGVMASDMDFPRAQGSIALVAFSVGFIAGIAVATRPAMKENLYLLAGGSAAGMMLVMLAWAACPSLWLMVLAWFFLGVTGTGHEVGSNSLMARLYSANVTRALVFYHSVWNVAAIFGPLAFGVLVNREMSWRLVPMANAVILAAAAALLWMAGRKGPLGAGSQSAATGGEATVWRPPWIFGVMMFFYTCTEGTLNNWGPSALQKLYDLSDAKTAQIIGGFWGLMGVSRWLVGLFGRRLDTRMLLAVATVLALIAQTVMVFPGDYHLGKNALWISGFCLCSSVSWIIAMAVSLQPAHVEKTTIFMMFTCGAGALVGPPLAGALAGAFDFSMALKASLFYNAALAAGCFWIWKTRPRAHGV